MAADSPADTALPLTESLKRTAQAFKASLSVTEEDICKIECDTRQQQNSSLWYKVQRYRLTASIFVTILQRKPDTPSDSLVLRILQSNNLHHQQLNGAKIMNQLQ